jgi:Bacterial Ig domain
LWAVRRAAGAAEAEGRTATTITFSCTGTGLSYSLVSGPSHGTLGPISGGQVTYTPNAGFSGPDSFQVTATNVAGQTATDTATVTVAAAPGPPTATITTRLEHGTLGSKYAPHHHR